jgi:hypothetical protein
VAGENADSEASLDGMLHLGWCVGPPRANMRKIELWIEDRWFSAPYSTISISRA